MNTRTMQMLLAAGLAAAAPALEADQVVADDQVVQGDVCVGTPCADGEVFDWHDPNMLANQGVKLKSSTTRLLFEDTSPAEGPFPWTDWMLEANDSNSGGVNRFSIRNIDGARTPFTIHADALSDSLVLSGGFVGIGTSLPAADLHVVGAFDPALRLEQPGEPVSDLWHNEFGTFLAGDVATDFTRAPLGVAAGAPNDALWLAPSGYIGIGTVLPTQPLHLVNENGRILVENTNPVIGPKDLFEISGNGNPEFRMTNNANGNSWAFSAGLRFVVKRNDGEYVFRVDQEGNGEFIGQVFTAGTTCGGGCDARFDPGAEIMSIDEQAAYMWANRHLPAVGPTPENERINLTEKVGGVLGELEKAHIYIEQLHRRIAALEGEVERLSGQDERIARLEALLGGLPAGAEPASGGRITATFTAVAPAD